jgi:hypothetical protein
MSRKFRNRKFEKRKNESFATFGEISVFAKFIEWQNIIYVIVKKCASLCAKIYFDEGKIARWMFLVSRNEKCLFVSTLGNVGERIGRQVNR